MSDVMYWKNADATDYLKSMKEVLKPYLPKPKEA